MPKNPAIYATVPKYKSAKREIWTAETLMHALEVCEDERLKLALNLVFPEESRKNKTVRVLKLPKTESSIRKVFLPKSVAEMLVEWKKG